MRTAEVAIEHVLAGLLALVAFALPITCWFDFDLSRLQTTEIVGVLGAAYMVGVVFDRVADTVLGPYEDFLRLQEANNQIVRHRRYPENPFPQDELEYKLRQSNDGRLEWMESLRSRIRTARELAVLGLPATLGATTFFADHSGKIVGDAFAGANLLLLCIMMTRKKRVSDAYRTEKYFIGRNIQSNDVMDDARAWRRKRTVYDWTMLTLSAIGAFVVGAVSDDRGIMALAVGGTVIVWFARKSWGRITTTYMRFVAQA